MQKHYLEVPHDDADKGKSLPDRSNLAALYPSPKKQNAPILGPKAPAATIAPKKAHMRRTALFVGMFAPLPLLLAKVLVEMFVSYGRAGDPFFLFALIAFTVVGWGAFAFYIYLKIHEKLISLGISTASFLTIQLSCLVLITPALFTCTLFLQGMFQQLAFIVVITVFSLLLSEILCRIILASLSRKAKNIIITLLLVACFGVAVGYLVSHI